MTAIPSTWIETTLGAVVPYGATVKAEPGDIAPETWVLELEDIEKDTTKVLQRLSFADRQSRSTKNRFDAGDVLYGKLRPYLNKVIFADRPGVCTTEIVPIKPTNALNGRYLFHWLRHPRFLTYVTEVSHGVNMPRLGTEAGRQAPFVLAPKNEQKRIADKLDRVLVRVDAVNSRLASIAPILKRFRQSVLSAATSGRLTEDWRGNVQCDWPKRQLQAICLSIADGDHQAPPQSTSGIPFVTISALSGGRLDLRKASRFVPESYFAALDVKRRPQPGDVLYSVTGSIGIPALVTTAEPFTFQRHIAILKPDVSQVSSAYLRFVLESSHVYKQALAVATGTAQMTIPLGGLRRIEVPHPASEEQAEIVRRVEALFAFADRLEARRQNAQTATERLTPALLAKAFRGELVPQNPNDEPANELLRRLKVDRPASKSTQGKRAAA